MDDRPIARTTRPSGPDARRAVPAASVPAAVSPPAAPSTPQPEPEAQPEPNAQPEPQPRALTRAHLHPLAWWAWAIGLATAASRVTNPWLLALILAVAGYVVAARKGPEPWSDAYRVFLRLGFAAIAIRLLFHLLLGGVQGPTVLFRLPQITLPEWAQGIRLGGPVTAEGAIGALYDGLRLATLLACVGAANALASPRRLVRSMPAALYEVSVAVVVALSMAPQLVASTKRVNRARTLRGDTNHSPRHILRAVVSPVLHDALDRSLALAAAMDTRGYGRTGDVPRATKRVTAILLLAGLLGLCVGAYGLLGHQQSAAVGWVFIGIGALSAIAGLVLAAKRVPRTRYRPDPFGWREWLVTLSGVAAVGGVVAAELLAPADLIPEAVPLSVPVLPLYAAAGVAVALLPAWVAPDPFARKEKSR